MGSMIEMLQEIGYLDWIYLAHRRVQWQAHMSTASLPAERFLASQEGFFSMELIKKWFRETTREN
jgi:hypothetical protein